jgi:hypothetical protein
MTDKNAVIPSRSKDNMTNDGDVLFKYKSMVTAETAAHTLDILKDQRLFCPSPDSFNDPFECQANISFDAPVEVKNERAKEQLMKENPNMTEAEAEAQTSGRWQQVEKNDNCQEFRRWLYSDTGVVSFSTVKDDILMWAHYAGGHDGVCIEFRCTDKSHVDFFGQAHPVEYRKELPKINFYTTKPNDKLKALILTKSEHWSYEKEWRIIVPDAVRKSRYILVPSGAFAAVYLGCQISKENRDMLLRSISSAPVRVLQAKRKSDAYGLDFEPISSR